MTLVYFTEGVYKMKLKLALGTFALLGSLYSVTTLANEIDLNLVCSYSSKTEMISMQGELLEQKHYKGTMGVRIERKIVRKNKVIIKIETLGEERIRFIIWVPFEPDSTPLENSASGWSIKAYNSSTETLLDFASFSSGRLGAYTGQSRILKIDRVTGVLQGTVIDNRDLVIESTEFNGSCQRADPSKRLF